MPNFIIEARDITYKRIGLVENYTSFEAIVRYNDVGSWTLTIPANVPEVALLQPGNGVVVRVAGQDEIAFSGPITKITRSWGPSDQGSGTVTVSGVTDEQILFQRVTYPKPDSDLTQQTDERNLIIAVAGHLMELLVSRNIGPEALPERRMLILDISDNSYGEFITITTRFEVLGERLQEIGNTNGIGFRVRQGLDNRLKFETFIPRDRSELIFGSQYGNLQEYTYEIEAPTATRVIFACQGEGKARYFEDAVYDPWVIQRIDDADEHMFFTGASSVSNPSAWDTTEHRMSGWLDLDFTGTGIRLYGRNVSVGNDRLWVEVDGSGTINPPLFHTGTRNRVLLYELNNLEYGEHHIWISSDDEIYVDYVDVLDERIVSDWKLDTAERFYDRRDIPVGWNDAHNALIDPGEKDDDGFPLPADPAVYRPLLDQAAAEAWEENGPKASLSMAPIDTDGIRYGRDYQVGDLVSVDIDGMVFTDILREVRLSDGDDGPRIEPLIGDSQASNTPTLYRTVRRLWSKIRKLEATR